MNNINLHNLTTLMKDLESRRSSIASTLSVPSTEDKKMLQKEVVKINSILNNLVDYKLNFMDEQPVKEPKVSKAKKNDKKEIPSYGIVNMINKK